MDVLTEMLSWLILVIVLSWVCAAVWIGIKDLVRTLVPTLQIHTMMLLVVTPAIISTLTLWFYQFPSVTSWLTNGNCFDGGCNAFERYMPASQTFSYVLLAGSGLLLVGVVLIIIRTIRLNARYSRALKSFSEHHAEDIYDVIDSERESAWCVGFFSPQIYLTQRLTETASPEQLYLIILHEINHVKRLDNLKRAVARICTTCWTGSARRAFIMQLNNALEIRSDYYAMRKAGATDVSTLPLNLCNQEAADSIQSRGRKAILAALLSRPETSVENWSFVYLALFAWLLCLFILSVKAAAPLLEYLLS